MLPWQLRVSKSSDGVMRRLPPPARQLRYARQRLQRQLRGRTRNADPKWKPPRQLPSLQVPHLVA